MTARENEVQLFNRGERVLCYEPDESKARVLYVSKVLAVYEQRDEANYTYFEYKIHFQGWSSSWDRNVRASGLLKDNEENRKLQRELAEAAQLQKSGGYSYKDTKTPTLPASKKQRLTRGGAGNLEDSLGDPLDISQDFSHKNARSRENSGNRARDSSGGRKADKTGAAAGAADASGMRETRKAARGGGRKGGKSIFSMRTPQKESANNMTMDEDKFINQDDRVMLRISERLRGYMEYDYNMVCMLGKQHALPARMPLVTILENFVKQRAVELAISIKQDSSRGRVTTSRNARMEREYDRVMSIVCMLKEVVDGLRIYFEFHLEDHLLYKEEKDYVHRHLTDDNLKNCSIMLNNAAVYVNADAELITQSAIVNGDDENEHVFGGVEYKKQRDKYLEYIVNNSGKNSMALAYDERNSPYKAADKLPFEMYGFLCETFNWRLLSAESRPEKSMMFGAPHLARLLVKLPEYLNVSPISNEKLEDLLKHLNSFINYLENHEEWFDKENYVHPAVNQEQLQQELLESLE
ncbi:protein male-specific lethal-3 [Drosophila nasuta]|uniref:protein male-specific lethal-3 n=1 Tax=Drosophila nasuta TaxID=42062 RepID=UPI00295F0D15|nr:protein male-specific lethal-3 [Drosophila nasuta]